jgi:hypothetical protein
VKDIKKSKASLEYLLPSAAAVQMKPAKLLNKKKNGEMF